MSRYVDIEPYEEYALQRYYRNSMGECVETVPLCGLPTADVVEVRHGRWGDIEHAPNGLLYATCSVCGKRQTIETMNYCGNCGARMVEE